MKSSRAGMSKKQSGPKPSNYSLNIFGKEPDYREGDIVKVDLGIDVEYYLLLDFLAVEYMPDNRPPAYVWRAMHLHDGRHENISLFPNKDEIVA